MTFQKEIENTIAYETSNLKIQSYLKKLIKTCDISVSGDIEASSRYSKTTFKRGNEKATITNSNFELCMLYDFRTLLKNKLNEQNAL